jgi:hypothetical protein
MMSLPGSIAPMADFRRWVGWKWVEGKDGKLTKAPFRGDFPEFHASTTKPNSWVPFATAAAACAAGKLDGIGYVCVDDAERVYWDLDECRDKATGEIADWAAAYVDECNSYTEITPSGEGLRIIGTHGGTLRAPIHSAYELPGGGSGEVFFRAVRYITVTGNRLPGTPDSLSDISGPVLDVLARAGRAAAANPLPDFGTTRSREDALAPIEDVRAALSVIRNDDLHYDDWVRIGIATFSATSGTGEGYEAWQAWSAKSAKHLDAECLRVWQSIFKSPPKKIGFGSLYYMAREVNPFFIPPSWVKPVSGEERPEGGETPFDQAPHGGPNPTPPRGIQLLSLDEIEALPPPTWLIHGLIPEQSIVIPYGPPKAGKTFVVLSMALHIAANKPWMGRQVVGGGVVYVAGEGVGGLSIRIRAMREAYAIPSNIPFWVVPRAVSFRDPKAVAALVEAIKVTVCDEPISLVVLDTLARAMPGVDENSAEEVGVVIAGCDELKFTLGATIMPIHHAGKDMERGLRGSSAIHGALDASLQITSAEGRVIVKNDNQKDAEAADPFALEMRKVELGLGRSSVVPFLADGGLPEEKRSRGRPRAATAIPVAALDAALAKHSQAAPPHLDLSPSMRVVPEAVWQQEILARLPAVTGLEGKAASAEANRRRMQAARLRTAAIAAGEAVSMEGFAWLP